MSGKYDAKMKVAIDVFWRQNKYPPTLRDLMKIVGISSTSVCSYVLRKIEGVRIAKNGRVIPLWVDQLFLSNNSVHPTIESRRVFPAKKSNRKGSSPAISG